MQPQSCTLRQASCPLVDAATGTPHSLAAALQTLFQFSLPGDSPQVPAFPRLLPSSCFPPSSHAMHARQAQVAVCCGVPVDTSLPLLFFALNMCAQDTFLYLTLQQQ